MASPALSPSAASITLGNGSSEPYRGPFTIMTLLFFMWGFMTVWNDILIPRFQEAFTLNNFQALLVQFAFFGAYAVGSLIYHSIWITSGDPVAQWTVSGVGLFCSVMFSNIFSLAIGGLAPLKSQVSSLLVMAILGGAILPPSQGLYADRIGIQYSFVVPMAAFAYDAFYGLFGYRSGRHLDSSQRETGLVAEAALSI